MSLILPVIASSRRRTPASSYLLAEYFEAAPSGGFQNSWTTANATVNPAYATAPAPLQGSYSLRLGSPGTARPNAFTEFTPQSSIYLRALMNYEALPVANMTIIQLLTAGGGTAIAQLGGLNGTGGARAMNSGGSTINAATAPTVGTTYYLHIEAVAGSGANAVVRVGFSLTSARPSWPASGSSGLLAVSINGTWTAATPIGRIRIGHLATGDANFMALFDEILIQSTPFA